ncbi:T9SS type A sorting domain-containing protein [Hymenobacter metallicola]|uniref:T9SS type A sorting domain-containing protein n=1 Tax=Hymenobacter metallicola TaxID=2563114 RepID=A0A4Z0Q9L3_9BACT|nr:T9SS type A sorting domain-containing protein [Hymenobacter metallicola]TGE26384.1 T9SS type A sorting domain-containing protein [Hymenobacter metallicola]
MKKRLLKSLALAMSLLGCHAGYGQTIDPSFQPTTLYTPASITSVVPQPDGKRLVVGFFDQTDAGSRIHLVRYNADHTVDQVFTTNVAGLQGNFTNSISNVRILPTGKLLLIGEGPLTLNGVTRQDLMVLHADGTPDASFDAGTATSSGSARVSAVQADGKILLGGNFSTYNGVVRRNIVRLLTTGAVDATFNSNAIFNSPVADIILQPDGRILVAGSFDAPAGVARLLSTGALDPSFTSPFSTDAAATLLGLQPDGSILVGGLLEGNNNEANYLVRLRPNGAQDLVFTYKVDNTTYPFSIANRNDVTDIVMQPTGQVVVPVTIGATQATELLTRFNADGTRDATFAVPTSFGSVNSLQQQANGQLLIGGSYFRLPNHRSSVALLTADGVVDPAFNPQLLRFGSVRSIVQQPDGKVLAAGEFDEVNGVRVNNLARFNADGSVDASFTVPVGPLLRMEKISLQPDGKVLGIGLASGLNYNMVRLLANGSPDNTWSGPKGIHVSNYVSQFALRSDGKIYVTNGSNLELLLANGQGGIAETGFYPFVANDLILTILPLPDGKVLVGGQGLFLGLGSNQYQALARLRADGSLDHTFSSPIQSVPDTEVDELFLQPDGKIIVGGFTDATYPSSLPYGLFRLLPTGGADNTFTSSLPTSGGFGWVKGLALQPNGRLLVAAYGNGLLRKMPDGSADVSFRDAGFNSDVEDVLVQPDGKILVAGSFTSVSGQPRVGLVRLTAPNVLHVASAQLDARTQAWPVPAHETLNLSLDATARPESVQLLDNLGRTVLTQPATQATLTLPLRHVKAGVYLLRVNYADGPITRRIVIE